MRERWFNIALIALVVQIPFELRYTLFGLSNLQWTFVALAAASSPLLLRNWQNLKRDRLLQAAALFVFIQWAAASYAPDFNANAFKAAIRFTAGLLLVAIARVLRDRDTMWRSWTIASTVAALYALLAYAGFGLSWLFREQEFYIGQIQRLSGSFEYPNTAAAYFAMSLPIVWSSSLQIAFKRMSAILLWGALILTFSRSGLTAVLIVFGAAALLAWMKGTEWRPTAALLAAGIAAYAVLTPLNPYLFEVFRRSGPGDPLAAEYKTTWNQLRQQPDIHDEIQVTIQNTGTLKWQSRGRGRMAISYRWLELTSMKFLQTAGLITQLPHDVQPGEMVEVTAGFQTPKLPGKYILVFELFGRNFDWFSQTGVNPVLIEADIQPSLTRGVARADLSHWYRMGQRAGATITASVARPALWRAALSMFVEHPFGVGPDNYRLQFGKYLGATHWDTHISSNSLYLELLTGSGILGLVAFGLVVVMIPWRLEPACLAIAVFLVHGLVDAFLMTTPIYFTFWILVGVL
jgi:hypothetical protein